MKKIFVINLAAIVALFSLLSTSCKKKVDHPTHPTPANNRLLSYSKYTTIPGVYRPVNENFKFIYDDRNRVATIEYSTNDSASYVNGEGQQLITFTYVNDTIYKTRFAIVANKVIERDTFLQNSSGLITTAYTPGDMNTFEYFGKLIARTSKSTTDSGTTISASSTFTSNNGDLLNHVYDGVLNVTFPDSGLSFYEEAHDTALTAPLTVTWLDQGPTSWSATEHTVSGYSDTYTGYATGHVIGVVAKDAWGVFAYDTCFWAGGMWRKETYYFYPELLNRTGDFLQIESYTMYGANIYQNAHLVKQIVAQSGPTVDVSYDIDADSKITQTFVKTTDVYFNVSTAIYKIQYETK